jgi:predicted TIM-barrel fold metal-dependent hydrolase
MEPLTLFVGAGILDRYPNVNIHFVECDIGWLAWIMQSMDRAYIKHQHWVWPKLSLMPSEFVKRQISCSFPEDPVGIRNRDITGVDSLMWGSDFPHHEGSWPHSRDTVAEVCGDCTVEEMKKITHDNAAKVFRFKADTFVEAKK